MSRGKEKFTIAAAPTDSRDLNRRQTSVDIAAALEQLRHRAVSENVLERLRQAAVQARLSRDTGEIIDIVGEQVDAAGYDTDIAYDLASFLGAVCLEVRLLTSAVESR